MEEYIFSEVQIDKGYNIIFLCGVKYSKSDSDKRKVLKKHLESLDSRNKVIILEENFKFGKSNKEYLSYDDIFMTNLEDVETLTAIFSEKVFIIHESISTSAELGMFITNKLLKEKLCLLIPDEYSVEENKLTAFLKLAFFNGENSIRNIIFYPEVKQWKVSESKSDFRTSFQHNEIGANLSRQIVEFLGENKNDYISVEFVKAIFGKYDKLDEHVSYSCDAKNGKIEVRISANVIKAHIISFFNISDFRTEVRYEKTLLEHITYIEEIYKKILLNTINEKEGKLFEYIIVKCKNSSLEFRRVISYTIYLLQAMKMIKLVQSETDSEKRKISITMDFQKIYVLYGCLNKQKITDIIGV